MITIRAVHRYDCDVLIAGGGPGGSALAFHLAQKGIKVIVLESQTFPRDKICGDAVSPVALAELQQLGIPDLEAFSKTNEIKAVALFIGEEKMTVGLSQTDNHPLQGRVIPRFALDNWIYQAAKSAGATYLEDTRLTDYTITEDFVSAEIKSGTGTKLLKAKVLAGADGSNSVVARILYGVKPSPAYQLLGLRAYFNKVKGPSDRCDIFFSASSFPGLLWLFPTGPDTANVGMAMIASTIPQNEAHIKTLLNTEIQNNKHLAERLVNAEMVGKMQGWPLTFHDPGNEVIHHRLLLLGDAAGLINPLSGDGIQYALLSARWACDCLTACVAGDDFSIAALNAYKEKFNQETAYDMALSNFLIQVTRNRTFTPLWMWVLKILFERSGKDPEYANVIAGIFDGTYPSYKVLNPAFLLKTVMQGGINIGSNAAAAILQGPGFWIQKGKDAGEFTATVIQSIRDHPGEQTRWLTDSVRKGMAVAGYVIKGSEI